MQELTRKYPLPSHFVIGLLIALTGAVVLWWLLGGNFSRGPLLTSWLAAINAVTLGYYGMDKTSSGRGRPRVPTGVLHALDAVGGSPAGLVAMSLFRHKAVDGHFRIVFWCIVVLQALFAACVWKYWWRYD